MHKIYTTSQDRTNTRPGFCCLSLTVHNRSLCIQNELLTKDDLIWWSMEVSAAKICNEFNHMKTVFNRKTTDFTLLLPTMFDWIDGKMNRSDDVQWNQQNDEWEWWNMKVSVAKICNESNHTKIVFNKKTAPTMLLRRMFDWINKMMNESNKVALSSLYNLLVFAALRRKWEGVSNSLFLTSWSTFVLHVNPLSESSLVAFSILYIPFFSLLRAFYSSARVPHLRCNCHHGSMKVSAPKIYHESNHTKIALNKYAINSLC